MRFISTATSIKPGTQYMLGECLLPRTTEELQRDARFSKYRSTTETTQVPALGNRVYFGSGHWSLPTGSPTGEATRGHLSCG